jgi:hypothetical protein
MIDLSELLVGLISLAVGGLAGYLTLRQQPKLDFVIERRMLHHLILVW